MYYPRIDETVTFRRLKNHLSSQIIIERKAEKPYCGYIHNMVE